MALRQVPGFWYFRLLLLRLERDVCRQISNCPVPAARRDPLAMGDWCPLSKLIDHWIPREAEFLTENMEAQTLSGLWEDKLNVVGRVLLWVRATEFALVVFNIESFQCSHSEIWKRVYTFEKTVDQQPKRYMKNFWVCVMFWSLIYIVICYFSKRSHNLFNVIG